MCSGDVLEFLFSGFYSFARFHCHFQFRFQTSKPPLSLSTHGMMVPEDGDGWLRSGLDVWNGEQ